MISVSIVIPTMNRLDSLKRTIAHIGLSRTKPLEVIVVDQSENEKEIFATKEFLKSQDINCIYLHQETPSLTKARNEGMKFVKGDLVIQMDDDVDMKPDTIDNIIDIFKNNDIAMLAGVNEGFDSKSRSLLGFLFWKKNL